MLAVILCPSVCPSQVGVVQTWLNLGSHSPYDSPGTLVFWCHKISVKLQCDHLQQGRQIWKLERLWNGNSFSMVTGVPRLKSSRDRSLGLGLCFGTMETQYWSLMKFTIETKIENHALNYSNNDMPSKQLCCEMPPKSKYHTWTDFLLAMIFDFHSPSLAWTSHYWPWKSLSLSWTSKSWFWSWSWNHWVFVLVLDKQVLNPSVRVPIVVSKYRYSSFYSGFLVGCTLYRRGSKMKNADVFYCVLFLVFYCNVPESAQIWQAWYKLSQSFTCHHTHTHHIIVITHGGMARLSWPGCLVTYWGKAFALCSY